MTSKDWSGIRFFSPQENWGNPGLMVLEFVQTLEEFRQYLGLSLVISCGTQGNHTADSWHYKGRAADIIIPDMAGKTLLDVGLQASRFGFTGIGLYRDWSYNGKRVGGLHLERAPGIPIRKYWLCTKEDGAQVYHEFSESNLTKLGFIGGAI